MCDPPVSVFRGASLSEETVKHLSSCGLRNALYVINATHLTENLFGKLVPCPFQVCWFWLFDFWFLRIVKYIYWVICYTAVFFSKRFLVLMVSYS